MSLYAVSDLHLCVGTPDKDMAVFGGRWQGYMEKIRRGFSLLTEEDVCVIAGDVSWGMSLEEALPDFRFLNELPGKKLLVKGNHDYWWSSAAKMTAFFAANGLDKLSLIHNNCAWWEGRALCATRGWFFEEETGGAHDKKVMLREIGRLETSLRAGGEAEKLVFLHYPPKYLHYECSGILELFRKYGVRECWYGHIHSKGCRYAFQEEADGTQYRLISADYMDFLPLKVR